MSTPVQVWDASTPHQVFDLDDLGDRRVLIERYANGHWSGVFANVVIAHAWAQLKARTAIVETNYIDRDFRSEYSSFYSAMFRQLPPVTHRIHFFAEPVPASFRDESQPASLAGLTYLGYVVVRPVPAAP